MQAFHKENSDAGPTAPFFVADHLALDFLNSIASPRGVPVEWLRDGRDLVDWLEQANVIGPDVAARFRRSNDQRALDGVAVSAREFRDWLRGFVTRHMGKPLTTGFGEGAWAAERTARGGHQLPGGRGGRWGTGAAAAAGPSLGGPRGTLATHRGGGGRPGLLGGLPAYSCLQGVPLHVGVSGPDEGPYPPVVQHGSMRQPGEGGGAPSKKTR